MWLDIRYFRENRIKLSAASPLGSCREILLRHQCRHLFSDCRIDKLIDGYSLTFRHFAELAVKRFWKTKVQCTHFHLAVLVEIALE